MTAEVEIILDPATALRARGAYWTQRGKLVVDADGSSQIDPDGPTGEEARRVYYARRQQLGPNRPDEFEPLTELRFRLAAAPDVGELTLTSASWSFAHENAASGIADELASFVGEGDVKATLKIEPVSFTAKNGPMKGQVVSYNKPVLTLKGVVPVAE